MPRYYFDLKNGRRIVDAVGSICENYLGAFATAKFKAARLAIDAPENRGKEVAVLNAGGDEIFKTPVPLKSNA